jgi:hypothetical protein
MEEEYAWYQCTVSLFAFFVSDLLWMRYFKFEEHLENYPSGINLLHSNCSLAHLEID